MKYYAIADLHGRYDLFCEALSQIKIHAREDEHKIIFLGDYIDRGPESRKIIQGLMDLKANDETSNVIAIQGNHESMMLESILKSLEPRWWMNNGGWTTLNSYGHEPRLSPNLTPFWDFVNYGVVPEEHIKFIGAMPMYYETPAQVFVHAGIPDNSIPLDKQDKEKMQWMMYGLDGGGYQGKHVVHGHVQIENGPHVFHNKRGGRTDLDVWAYKTGRLVIGVYDDTQGSAKSYLTIKKTKA